MTLDLTVKELYSKLKNQAKKSEIHTVSMTNNSINHYISNNYNEKDYLKVEDLNEVKDINFVNTTSMGIFGSNEQPSYTSLKEYMGSHEFREKDNDGEVVFVYGNRSKLPQVFVMHNHFLGPGIGGLREFDYKKQYGKYYLDSMLIDSLRLAEAMTYKGAINETASGGGKAARSNKRLTLEEKENTKLVEKYDTLRSHANLELATSLNIINDLRIKRGVYPYFTAEDVGTSCSDFDEMFSRTKYSICKSVSFGGTGNPSPYTAIGTVYSMIEGAKRAFEIQSNPLEDKTVLLEGLGNCGIEVLKHLVNYNANVKATDIQRTSIERAKLELGDHSNKVDFLHYNKDKIKKDPFIFIRENKGDIYSPCALGARINKETRRLLYDNGIKLIAGSANNQLTNEEHDSEVLFRSKIWFLPDYVVNAGGLINARQELPDVLHRMDNVVNMAKDRSKVVSNILDVSIKEKIPPLEAVQRIVKKRLKE